MAHYAGGSSFVGGGAPESNWPLNLDSPAMEELHRYELLVPTGCRLAKPWNVSKDGYATMPPSPRDGGEALEPSHRPVQHPRTARLIRWQELQRRHLPAPARVGGCG
ncbi:hypothetical protein ZWY2020_011985 [Hordeum vulgare]|nr:hypothetical protein ZWY2020_011985 [Hordeum vulgare]